MNTSQLQCCIDCSPVLRKSVIGVFAADQLPLSLRVPCGLIVNTDVYNKEGQHWCSFYFPSAHIVEYFDSYGKSIDYYNKYFPKYVTSFSKVTMNSKQLQSSNSDVCGMYALFFLLHRLNSIRFSNIVNMFSSNTYFNDEFVYNYISNVFFRMFFQQECV